MEKSSIIRTIKAYLKQSISMSWPVLVMMLFDLFIGMTDVKVASYLDKDVQAAVGLANSIYIFFTFVLQALTVGTVSAVSRIFGKGGDRKGLAGTIHTAVSLALIIAAVFTVAAFIIIPVVINNVDVAPDVKEKALMLGRIYTAGLFFHLAVINLNGVLRACRKMIVSMKIMGVAASLNIVLNVFLVFYTPLGFKGIAAATAVSWVAAFIPAFKSAGAVVSGEKYFFDKSVAASIVKIALPVAVVTLSWQISSVALFWMIGKLPDSTEIMAAYTVGLRIESVIFLPAFAFNMANAVIVGNLLGAGKPNEAFQAGLVTIAAGVGLIICLTVCVLVAARPLASFFAAKDSAGMADPKVVGQIVTYLYIVMISEPLIACNAITTGALSGAGDTRPLMFYTLVSIFIVRLPFIYICAIILGLGVKAVWWGLVFTFCCQAFLTFKRFISRKWVNV